ncbi:MAG: restriction endonuclease subunit S, partial [archaeon]|nr:restriction endonuclease subunit S [archaeon]
SNFLYFFMKMNEKKLENKGTGSTFKAINRKEIEKIKVLVPSLSIQKRIVSILERAEKLKEKRKQANELMSKLPQSVFLEMFQDYINDAKKFVEIGELCEVKGGKRVPKGEQFSDVPTKHPYLRVTDMVDFGINQEGLKYIKDDIFERIKNYTITKEDVYITIAGTIGLSGIIPNSLNGASLTENAAKLVIKDKEKVNRIFLANIVASNIVQSQIKIRTGVVGVPKLALQRIKTIKIPLPPLSLQKQFASHIENINTLRQKQNESTESSNNLFDSLLQKAFNGELVT